MTAMKMHRNVSCHPDPAVVPVSFGRALVWLLLRACAVTHLVRPEEQVELPGLGVHGQAAHEQGADLENRKETRN